MQKVGTIINIPLCKDADEQMVTVAFDGNEAELCSIRSIDGRRGCAACSSSCTTCGVGGQQTGLFAVQGNIVNALNDTGRVLRAGQRVQVQISKKAVWFQGIYAVGLPLLLSILFFILIFMRTKSETLALAGIAGGLLCGSCLALGISLMIRQRIVLKVVTVYE